jgi:hypothetical protein
MSDLKKGDEESGHHRIRITLTSRNKDEVEKGAFLFLPFPPVARVPRLRLPCCLATAFIHVSTRMVSLTSSLQHPPL